MVKNKAQLNQEASNFISNAGKDLKEKVTSFMEELDITDFELADILGIPESEMDKIMNGDINTLHINTFAKLLIATNNAIQIIPVEETPIGAYGNGPRPMVPPFVAPPFPFGVPQPQRRVDETLVRPQRKNEAPNGHQRNVVGNEEENFYRTKTFEQLVSIIKRNLWDSEINLNVATKEQLVKFLANKDRLFKKFKNEYCREAQRPTQRPTQRTATRRVPISSDEDEKKNTEVENLDDTVEKAFDFLGKVVKDNKGTLGELLKSLLS